MSDRTKVALGWIMFVAAFGVVIAALQANVSEPVWWTALGIGGALLVGSRWFRVRVAPRPRALF